MKRFKDFQAIPGLDLGGAAVRRVALGTASWSLDAPPLSEAEAGAVLEAALVHEGVTVVDTARVYASADGLSSELLLREAIERTKASDHVLIASKGGHFRDGDRFVVDGRPEAIRDHCERSLRALGLERISLYFLHKPDPLVPLVESIGAIADLQERGKVGLIGVSNVTVEQLAEARSVAVISGVQNHTNLRTADPVLAVCELANIPYFAYAPFNGSAHAKAVLISPALRSAADERGCSAPQLLLALLFASSSVLGAVVGARRPETIADSKDSEALRLDDVEAQRVIADVGASAS